MATAEIADVVLREDGRLAVNGTVTIENVVAVMERGLGLFDREELAIDLAGVTEVDSSAVSLLLEWQREALHRNRPLLFVNIPQKLQSLLRLYGILELITRNAETDPGHLSALEPAAP